MVQTMPDGKPRAENWLRLGDTDLGCHYHCYRDRAATERVIRQFRTIYSTAPIHLISDGGEDFSDLKQYGGILYYHEPWNIGLQINTTEPKMREWLRRFRYVCEVATEPWILILEDDVEVRRAISTPQFAMTGNHAPGKTFNGPLGKYIFSRQPHLANLGYGGGGGTLVSRETAIEAVENYLEFEDFAEWTRMAGGNASDLWLTAMVMLIGHQYAPNPDLAETRRHRNWQDSKASIIHHQGGWKP